MRRFSFVLPLVLIALLATAAVAQKTKRNGARPSPDTAATRQMQTDTLNGSMAADTMNGAMDTTRMGMHACMGMMGPMMAPMMGKQLLLARDGGVFVLMGNHLIKYDEKLNLVKDVEIPMNIDEMCRTMQDFMSRCPAMQKKMPMMGPGSTPAR